jgi:ribonucleotide monophosphatase NagD (HAD superfamily)
MLNGARLLALHKNKFWKTEAGLQLDLGCFIAGLEYVTQQEATLAGKPSPLFFQAALERLALPAASVAMVGDDIDSDVGGAQAAGLLGVLVRTGKYTAEYAARSRVEPDLVLDSVAHL